MFRFRRKTNRNRSVKKKVISIKHSLGIILFISGVLLVVATPIVSYIESNNTSVAFEDNQVELTIQENDQEDPIEVDQSLFVGKASEDDKPRRIIIPKLNIDVLIRDAKVVNKKWEVFEDVASYGLGSGLPDREGNTVIFAHARRGLFLPLREIEIDTEIIIFTKESWYTYKVVETKEVNPKEISVISPTDDETLTLYTCSGFADTKRLIVVAKPLDT